MERSPVLPVRFGAVFSSREALETFVDAHYCAIASFFERITGKEEWSVKAFVNIETSDEWAKSSDPALVEEWRCLPNAPGKRYFIEKRLKSATRRRAILSTQAAAEEIRAALLARAIEVVSLPQRIGSRTDLETILNLALLVPRPAADGLGGLADTLGSRFSEQGISLECCGPWPPFHFCPSLDRTPS